MELSETLTNLNPWWSNRDFEVLDFQRDDFEKIYGSIEKDKEVTAITGPRQVGKTTMIRQSISKLLEAGIPSQNILYLNFDNRTLRIETNGDLDAILSFYSKRILQESHPESKNKIFIFIDEVQKLEDWGNQVKYWQDLMLNVKFILSGSSSLKLIKGSGESLLGRIKIFVVLTFSFKEFASFNGLAFSQIRFKELINPKRELTLAKDKLEILLNQYMQEGGYPLVLKCNNLVETYKTLLDLKSLSIKRDILDIEPLRESSGLEDLLTLLADASGNNINATRLASSAHLNVLSVQKYLGLFEASYFIRMAKAYSGSMFVSSRKEKKLFFLDPGMINALLYKLDFPNRYLGKIAENILFSHIMRLRLNEEMDPKIFYWGADEVDFIFSFRGKKFLIELKYQDTINERDLNNIKKFLDKHETDTVILITKNQFDVFKYKTKNTKSKTYEIYAIPLYAFLLWVD